MNDIGFENLLEDFNILDSWEDKYKYIIDLGKELEPYPDAFRTDDHRVLGCASQVWFYPIISKVNGKTFFSFKGDSDAMIVKGLLLLIERSFNGHLSHEIIEIDGSKFLESVGLDRAISSQRTNGFSNAINKIQKELLG